ncbi:MAG TPA: hypothetical protein VL944_02825 [Candidatus Acidoferrum sp.]|nr:hypothetical protein [Candidatus Acidoferrum sp.]
MTKLNARIHVLDRPLSEGEWKTDVSGTEVLKSFSQDDQARLDSYWGALKERFPALFRKPVMLNLRGLEVSGNGTIRELDDLGDYAMFAGKRNPDVPPVGYTGSREPGTIYTAGLSPEAALQIRPRGVSTVAQTSDGFILFGRRPANVMAPNQISILPEGMLVAANSDQFQFTRSRLERETGIDAGSISRLELVGIAEEQTHCSIQSTAVMELSKTRAGVEASMRERQQSKGIGIPEGLEFRYSAMSTLLDYLDGSWNPNRINPAACNAAILTYIQDQHGQAAFEKAIERVNGQDQTYLSLRSFMRPMGVPVSRLARA